MSWRWYEGIPLNKSHTVSFQVGSLFFYLEIRVNTSRFIVLSSYIWPCTCSAHEVSADSIAEVQSLIPYVVGPFKKSVKTPVIMRSEKACYKRASSKYVNESCNKDHKVIICLIVQRCHGYTRYWHVLFYQGGSNFCLVSRFPQKASYKSDLCLLLLNNQRIKWHVNHF